MITFIILAAALTFAVALAIAVPLLKRDKESTSQAPWTAMVVIAVLVVGGAASYVAFSNWPWTGAQQAAAMGAPDSPAAMVERLRARLNQNPQDLQGWLMLGRSYMVLDQAQAATRAFEHADRLAGGKNAEALIGLAESLAVQDENALEGDAGQMLEKALALEPNNGKALFYGGAAALRRGDLPVARQRFAALLAMNPPDNVRPILEQQVAAIDSQIRGEAPGSIAASTAANTADPRAGTAQSAATAADAAHPAPNLSAANAGTASAATSSNDPAAVHVNVMLSPKLSASLPAGAPLFVFVRDPKQPGPPLAVKRLSNRFPQAVELTAADAMVPGRELAAGQQVQVVARIARSGTPTAQSGDPFGEVGYRVGRDKVVDIVIDRLTP